MDFFDLDYEIDGENIDKSYNDVVSSHLRRNLEGKLLHSTESAEWSELEEAQSKNVSSRHRCVGLVLKPGLMKFLRLKSKSSGGLVPQKSRSVFRACPTVSWR